jgi:hypothetical protein
MNGLAARAVEVWEDEGGATPAPPAVPTASLSGTASQVEWAGRIRRRVQAEFDRVGASFRSVAGKQADGDRADTEAILAILEDKRSAVMSREEAGYFIHDWQDISDQVRQLIGHDHRYQAIRARRAARRRLALRLLG